MAYRVFFALALSLAASFPAIAQPSLAAATLPNARSVSIGEAATVFATVLNSGDTDATNCRVALDADAAPIATLVWQRTDATNTAVGNQNEAFTIPAGGSQTLVLGVTASQTLFGSYLGIRYICDETEAPAIQGTNDILLRAAPSTEDVADVIMVLQTLSGDGVIRLPENGRRGVAAGSLVNIGDTADIVLWTSFPTGNYFNAIGPIEGLAESISLCRTNASGQCLSEPALTLELDDLDGSPVTFNVYINDDTAGGIPLLPEFIRLSVRAEQDRQSALPGISGATTVAAYDAGPAVGDEEARGRWWGYYGGAENALTSRFTAVLASDGTFALLTDRNPGSWEEIYFGQVTTAQESGETVISGSLRHFSNGTEAGVVEMTGLRLNPVGLLRGRPGVFNNARMRGYFVSEPPAETMPNRVRRNDQSTARYQVYFSRSFISERASIMNLRSPDDEDPYEFDGNYFVGSDPAPCLASLRFTPGSGTPAPQTFDAELTLSECAPSHAGREGRYTGRAVTMEWETSPVENGAVLGCGYMALLDGPDGQREYFTLRAAFDQSISNPRCMRDY